MMNAIATTYENYSHCWHTPEEWIAWVNETFLGKPVHDPCPKNWDGVDQHESTWGDRNYVNHPGERGSTPEWWRRCVWNLNRGNAVIWCAFNVEQKRHMVPSPSMLPGWLIEPRERIGFIWGGPDIVVNEKAVEKGAKPKWRRHGEQCKSPGNWTIFWSSVRPAPTPIPCVITQTGVAA